MQRIKDALNASARLKQTVAEILSGDIHDAIVLLNERYRNQKKG